MTERSGGLGGHRLPRLCAILAAALAPGAARPGAFSSVEPAEIAAGAFYDGAVLHVRGSVAERAQVAIRVTGALELHSFNRRGRIAGLFWGGVERVTFRQAPSLYALYTSAALGALAGPAVRDQHQLGYPALAARIDVEGTQADRRQMVEHFLRLKESEGLYRVAPGSVHLADAEHGRRAFEVAVPLPATAPPGDIEVAVLELSDGLVTGQDRDRVRLVQVGLPAALFRLAHERSALFGLLAVALLLATGLAVDLLGSLRGTRGTHPAVVVLAGLARGLDDAVLASRHRPLSAKHVERMHARVGLFRNLLTLNSELLELLAELEEESSWTSFRHVRVRMGIRALFDGTADMVRILNQLTGDRYFDLANVIASLRADVSQFLEQGQEGGAGELAIGRGRKAPCLALQLKEIDSRSGALVGGKAVNLARIECDLGLSVPGSFSVTIEAYREFMDLDGLAGKLRVVLAPARLDAADDFRRRCELAQRLVREARAPPSVAAAVEAAWRASGFPPGEGMAVRSSATGEGSELSFAGQFETVLNVPASRLLDAWKEVVCSRFSPRAVFYRRAAGLAEVDTPMAVLVQRMVPAVASGVLFTRRPDDPRGSGLLIHAVRGLGPEASAGVAQVDQFVLSRGAPHRILERSIARKPTSLHSADGGGLVVRPMTEEEQFLPSISADQASRLAAAALAIERYFGGPQDVEWAVSADGTIQILQARSVRLDQATPAQGQVPADAQRLLSGGSPVWPGRAVGPVHLARSPADLERTPAGALLVVPQLRPDCVQLLSRVCGIVAERGTLTGHAASVLREFRIASLFGVPGALDALVSGQLVSLDAAGRSLYAGALWPELRGRLPVMVHGGRTTGLPELLAGKLTKLSSSAFIGTWACQSLHDVIRYAHEVAIQSMFDIGDRLLDAPVGGVRRLECAPPLTVHVVDLGGGLSPESARESVKPDQVLSAPFRGIWRGLGDPFFRPRLDDRPPPAAAVRARSMVTAGLGSPNYACITDAYLNLSSRQAHHYAMVDSFLSDDPNANHVSVRLRGGGAAPRQRALRAELVAEVLRLHDFSVSTSGDIVSGWIRGIDRETGEDRLAMLGHLLRFLPRLDLAMTEETQVRGWVEAFRQAEEQARTAARDPAMA
jgi:pyruvate, water dikinase